MQNRELGFGTWRLEGEVCTQSVKEAYKIGYRLFDTATLYHNFDAVRKGLEGIPRDAFYLISKVWPDMQSKKNIRIDLDNALKSLGVDYLDAYFIHWPNSQIPLEETLGAMESFRQEGKIRSIGFSNVTTNHMKKILPLNIPVEWVQVEMHPLFCDTELLHFCQKHSIGMQAWAPVARGKVFEEDQLIEIGKKYGKTASQIALRWIIQMGVVPIPGSKNPLHIQENFAVTDFTLTQEEVDSITKKAVQGSRMRMTKSKGYGIEDEFDLSYEECYPS